MLLATDLADSLVRRGVPFRKAHELVGKAVAMSISTGTPLQQAERRTIRLHFKCIWNRRARRI